jgi:2-methylcitrate dehydratase PrpD
MTVDPIDFILGNAVAAAPSGVWHAVKRSLLDLIGVAAAGRTTHASRIAHQVAIEQWPAGKKQASLTFDGRKAAPGGAAFAGAQTIDSIDAHDGYKPAKGHAGVAILPGVLAIIEAENLTLSGGEFLEAILTGYEIACRVASAQHKTCPDYHASGSWNAVGMAAAAARVLKLDRVATREALGIAEYFGPRAQIMRVVDLPTMVKDASNWGAMTGVVAAYLAASGLTGAPALTVERSDATPFWQDLGSRWLIEEQYFKLWPVCRWAQPAVKAALDIAAVHQIHHEQIQSVVIETFHEACRLAGHSPVDTDQAQYAIAFPTACAFVRGRVGVKEVTDDGLQDNNIRALAERIQFTESAEFNAAFPARRFSRLHVRLNDGRSLSGPPTEPPGDPEQPLSDQQIVEKFFSLATPVIGEQRATSIHRAVGPFGEKHLNLCDLFGELREPVMSDLPI